MYTIFTRGNCELCMAAKRYCLDNDISYNEVFLLTQENIEKVKALLPEEVRKSPTALPIVFDKDQNYIGGYEAMVKHHNDKLVALNTKWEKDAIFDLLRHNVCTVVFEKVNGEMRKMKCTLMEDRLPEGVTVGKTDATHHDNFLAVYDIENEGWRGFRINSIQSINIEVV